MNQCLFPSSCHDDGCNVEVKDIDRVVFIWACDSNAAQDCGYYS